ncbi:MAG: DNA primase [Deltaproteobacteria bacterium]|nr:DNA primase [Deltaproteobacteria bacterium]
MGAIPEDKIAEIKARASILEVVSDFLSVKKAGRNHLGLCPFHDERTPSFTVNEEKGVFHCFGCGAGGDVFAFLMRAGHLSFPEAVRQVAKRYGIDLPERELSPEEERRRTLRGRLFELNELAAEYFHQILTSKKEGEEGRAYFDRRGISAGTIETYRLGFATAAWDGLTSFLKHKGVPLSLAETAGLVLPRGEAAAERSRFYDRFRRRIIFPILNEGDRVCGFGGRLVEDDPSSPKYMNSPESPAYSKGLILYGLHAAKSPIRERDEALIVEGYMDLLSLYQEGVRNAVASLGTALTASQVHLLARFARHLVLIYDADAAGQKATPRSLDLFLQEGVSGRVVSLPAGNDPDSFIRREGRARWAQVLEEALPLMEFLLRQALKRHGTETIEGKVRVVRELLPALNRLRDPLEQSLYVERLATRLGLKEVQIRAQLAGRLEEAEGGHERPGAGGPAHERLLLQLMLQHGGTVPVIRETMVPKDFSVPLHQRLARELWAIWEEEKKIDLPKLLSRLEDDQLQGVTAELLLEGESITDAGRTMRDCLRQVRLSRLRQEIRQVDEEISRRSRQEKEGGTGSLGLSELLRRKLRLKAEQKKWLDDAATGGIRLPVGR